MANGPSAPPAGITKRVGVSYRPGLQVPRCAVPNGYTFADHAHGLARLRSDAPGVSGLDQPVSMFAPCLRGRPSTGRQGAVLTSLRLARLRDSSACHGITVTQVFKKRL